MDRVDSHEENPKDQADDPGMPSSPVLEDKLRRSQIRRDRDSIVEPVVPREGEAIRRGEESGSIRVEGTW